MSKMSNFQIELEEIKNDMCDNFCKWPFNTETQADLNEICKDCPLSRLEEVFNDEDQ